MIQLTKKAGSQAPAILINAGTQETNNLIAAYNAGNLDFEFNSKLYGHADVKDRLIKLQSYKCCFCESKIGHISYGDVEHFRPKGGWIQADEQLNKPGYFWLAYNWENLLLSCQLCNQRFKKNHFPLINNDGRADPSIRDITNEHPVFIDIVNENPEQFIAFAEEIPIAINQNARGKETIKKLGLNRELLNEQRRKTLNMVRDIYDLARGYPDTYPQLKAEAKAKILNYYNSSQLPGTEYASMLRSFFNVNPINF